MSKVIEKLFAEEQQQSIQDQEDEIKGIYGEPTK